MRPAALLALGLVFAPGAASADDETPVALDAGTATNLCATGVVTCPVNSFLCDDPKVAIIESGPQGAVVKAVGPGTTLCAVTPFAGTRRMLRVTVKAPKAGEGAAPAR
jgi:hypothetical protein